LIEGVSPYNTGLHLLRGLGFGVYGFHPLEFPDGIDDGSRRTFGNDERIAKSSLLKMVRIMFEACVRLAS
jgi:hypothetical protein